MEPWRYHAEILKRFQHEVWPYFRTGRSATGQEQLSDNSTTHKVGRSLGEKYEVWEKEYSTAGPDEEYAGETKESCA